MLDYNFDEDTIKYIQEKMSRIKFGDRSYELFKLALKLYWKLFSNTNVSTTEFKTLHKVIKNIYREIIVIVLYFR